MNVRIGIDVGGTFTDAVVIDSDTYRFIGSAKVLTTHDAKEGVAAGIIQVLHTVMERYGISPKDVRFIAHGTTQATNALLEGDVAKVGIVSVGTGLEGIKTRADTTIGSIPLAPGKFLFSDNVYIDIGREILEEAAASAINTLHKSGADAIVASEAFSVDNPENENKIVETAEQLGLPATAGNDVSKLYGLKIRTRTAVVNASIMPKMLDTANMTEKSIMEAGIAAPLMVMRCDGGVMTIKEVRSRPIMTILSGPAAGVAGALMYEKLTDGLFFEVGGTSTDISCVKDGKVMVKYAEVGGHKTYLNSLDVRTVGIGGGSMIALDGGKIVGVGPRSAHIAKMDYEVYADSASISNPVLKTISPREGDANYAYVECNNGLKFALTLSGAANICGYVKESDYAWGCAEAARAAWKPLADSLGLSIEETARTVLELSAATNGRVVDALIHDYSLDKDSLVFVGGGGGAASVVPHIAETYRVKSKMAQNAEVISPIGVALAMVRDVVERTIHKPTEDDILRLRQEAIQAAIKSGANPDTVEVQVEVDGKLNKVRAIAVGTTELRTKDLGVTKKTERELRAVAADSLRADTSELELAAENGTVFAYTHTTITKKFLSKKRTCAVRVVDEDGVIRLQRRNAYVGKCTGGNWRRVVRKIAEDNTMYGDGGEEIPNLYLFVGARMVDVSSIPSLKQIIALCDVELAGIPEDMEIVIVCTKTAENDRG